jgi:peptidoglycan-associated lipoprotein
MNHTPNQSTSSQQGKPQRPSLQTGVDQSDSKEILFLAAGLITLVLGLGGLFMYSVDEPLPATASQEAAKEVSTFQMTKAFATPTPPSPMPIPNAPEIQEAIDTDVYFEFNRWALSDGAKSLLKTQVETQPEEWNGMLHIDGHTDAQGTDSYNRALGLKRAKSVKTYLVSLGISEDRIQVQSFGKDGAICQEQTPDCFEHNRRAHVAFLSQPVVQQDDPLLSMTPDALEDSTPEASSPMSDSPSTEVVADEIAVQEEISGELVAVDQLAPADSLP